MKTAHIIPFTPLDAESLTLYYRFECCTFGRILLAETSKGLCYASPASDKNEAVSRLAQEFKEMKILPALETSRILLPNVHGNVIPEYFHLKGSAFQLEVWEALLSIPFGETSTYGRIASAIGRPKAARAVGAAVGKNPVFYWIPCHRVIPSNGGIGNYFWGSQMKQEILLWETTQSIDQRSKSDKVAGT